MALVSKYYDLMKKVSPVRLRNYLSHIGWQEVHKMKSGAYLYKTTQESQVVVPSDPRFVDYPERVYDVVKAVKGSDDFTLDSLVNRINYLNSDVLRFPVRGRYGRDGTLPFSIWYEYSQSIKNILLSSCNFTNNPKGYHKKLYTNKSSKWIDSCRMGQTEFGSYVTKVICPLEEKNEEQIVFFPKFEDEPFTRRVTANLLLSINNIAEAIEMQDVKPIIDGVGVSANMCDSLIDMFEISKGDIYLEAEWSPVRPMVHQISSSVKLSYEHIKEIENIKNDLTPREVVESIKEYVGYVFILKRDQENDEEKGEITISTHKEQKATKIHFELDVNEYKLAIDAHKENIPVLVKGKISRRGNKTYIEKVEEFKVFKS